MEYSSNDWVRFLRKYGPVPRNDAMYDESIQRLRRKMELAPLEFEVPLAQQLVDNFKSTSPASVILTGTAGDGKTHLCGVVWKAVGGSPDAWSGEEKIRRLKLPTGHKLVVVKDLSEVSPGRERKFLVELCKTITTKATDTVYLIAANDGQLVSALKQLIADGSESETASAIERMLVTGAESDPTLKLHLYNLSRTDVPELFARIVEAVLSHPGWKACAGCPGAAEDVSMRCPIWHNYNLVRASALVRKRMADLLTLCELNDLHFSIRQMLVVISNTLLGHPDATDGLLSCKEVPEVLQAGTAHHASPYRNVFGGNLSSRRRETMPGFEALGRFGIGNETNNRIDNILIYGSDDTELRQYFDELVANDRAYGSYPDFLGSQKDYLEGAHADETPRILDHLEAARQRLFFTIPEDRKADLKLWQLSLFRHGGEYLEKIYRPLRDGKTVERALIYRLARGLNRIFTGLFITEDRTLYVASSASNSQSKVSTLLTDKISVDPRKGEKLSIEYDPARRRVLLSVSVASDLNVAIPLHPVRYEFLSRVADGALPSSFSRECYEDFLAFKSRVHRAIEDRVRAEGGQSDTGPLRLVLLEVHENGLPLERHLEVQT